MTDIIKPPKATFGDVTLPNTRLHYVKSGDGTAAHHRPGNSFPYQAVASADAVHGSTVYQLFL
jgi:hypothetical protein